MGEIVGAAVVSHVPPIVMPEALRRELNDGSDFSLVEGLHRLRAECLAVSYTHLTLPPTPYV